jgi:MFS superfamily sulfate permease-like transporter
VLLSFLNDTFYLIPAAALSGLAVDAALRRWRPRLSNGNTRQLRLFAFGVPALVYAVYFVALALSQGISWSIHLWAGSVVLAGTVGWLLSYLVTESHPRTA